MRPVLRKSGSDGAARPTVADFGVKVCSDILAADAMAALSEEARLLWDYFGGSRSQAKSFWVSRDETPRCNLEAFAQAVAAGHRPGSAGAEFWVQYREGDSSDGRSDGGLEFHFDKDEEAMRARDEWIHPDVSTVTYLKSSSQPGKKDPVSLGAPLVVFSTESEDDVRATRLRPRQRLFSSPDYSWTVPPRPGSHVTFKGSLLHGVPSELNPLITESASRYERMSLPVNIWNTHRPSGAIYLPEGFIDEINKDRAVNIKLVLSECDGFHELVSQQSVPESGFLTNSIGGAREEDWYQLAEHRPGDTAQLPLNAIRSLQGGRANGPRKSSRHSGGVQVIYQRPTIFPLYLPPVDSYSKF